jgi:signal transduction histidine kinase
VESFISRAAVALENANLYKQLEWAAALEERQRIAANVHDGLAQTISLLGLKVDQAVRLLTSKSGGKALGALRDIRETVGQISIEVRKSIASLQDPPRPRQSLQEILISLVKQQSANEAITFDTMLSFPEPLFLHPDHVAQIIPIIQEAIINARRHSNATRIQILGQQTDDLVTFTISDNGCGFDEKTVEQKEGHFGLKVMQARSTRFGGRLQIVSKPGHGTIVTLSWVADRESRGKGNLSRQPVRPISPTEESETYA